VGVYLFGVYLMGVYLMGVYLMGVYLTSMYLTGVHVMGVCLRTFRSPTLQTVVDLSRSEFVKDEFWR